MKKFIAWLGISIVMIFVFGYCIFYEMFYEPIKTYYTLHGWVGVLGVVIAYVIIGLVLFGIFAFMGWAAKVIDTK